MHRPSPPLFWLSAAAFASAASLRICDAMLPALALEFHVDIAAASLVVTLYTISYGASQLIHGPLGDRIGKARYIAGAALIGALASLLCALSPTLGALQVARFLSGMIVAAIVPLAMAWFGDAVPYGERQAILARFLNGMILGVILGQAMGGFFADTLGWRWAFVALSGIFAVSGWRLLHEPASNRVPAGSVETAPSPKAGMLHAYAVVVRARWARTILIVVAAEGMFALGVLAFIPTWLHERAGLPVSLAGAAVAAFGLGGFVYTSNAPRLLRHLGETGLTLYGGAAMASGFIVIALVPGMTSAAFACAAIGLGYHMLHNTLQTHATQMAPAARGTGVALFAMSLFAGQSIGVIAAAAAAGRTGYAAVFIAAGIGLLTVAAAFAMLLRRRSKNPNATII